MTEKKNHKSPHVNVVINQTPVQTGALHRNHLVALLLAVFLGWLGIDRFYLGSPGVGIIKLLTFGLFGILWFVDLIMIATKSVKGIVWVETDGKIHTPAQDQAAKNWFERHKVLSITVALVFTFGLIGAVSDNRSPVTPSSGETTTQKATSATPTSEPESKKPDVPAEYISALNKATSYANTMNMSKQGVYDQLVSTYGEQFSAEAAQYGIDNVKADWNANALAKAKSYQKTMSMSPAAIHDQLTSAAGEKFTVAEADYAITHLNE